jgi:ATP/maltotriose-dependent transcriptional regulator MalT
MLEEALASAQQSFKAQVPSIQMEMSDILRAQGDGAGAKKLAQQMLKESQDAGQKEDAAFCQYLLAQSALGEGRLKDAEDLARQAAEGLTELGSADEEPDALGVLMESLAGQKRVGEAQQAMSKAEALARQSQDVHIQMHVATSSARVQAAAGKTAEATAALNAVLARAVKIGCVRCSFEARLALGEVEMRSGNKMAGQARLKGLEKDASARGFVEIARRAAGG